jgi:hypothetical protein
MSLWTAAIYRRFFAPKSRAALLQSVRSHLHHNDTSKRKAAMNRRTPKS